MKHLAKKIKEARLRKLPVMIALVAAFVLPTVISAYALENTDTPAEPLTVANLDDNGDLQTETTTDETPVEETPVPETPAPETPEEPIEDPETPVVEDGVTLGEAQIIAQTEHDGSTLKHVKTKVFEGNAVYVFHFEDGWKVYVRATDGVVVLVKDPGNKNHDCKNKLKDNPEFQSWLEKRKEQRKQKHNHHHDDDKDDNRKQQGWAHGRRR